MSEPIDTAALAAAANDIKKLSAWFAGLAAIGPELAKIASIEGAIRESRSRLDAARGEEDKHKVQVAAEAQAVRDDANAYAATTREAAQQDAQAIRARAAADSAATVADAQAVRDAAVDDIAARHATAAEEIAAKHKAADGEIADRHAGAVAQTDREIAAKKEQLAALKGEIAKLLSSPILDQMRQLSAADGE